MAPTRCSGYDFLVAGPDEVQARTMLVGMQERLARSPYEALGVTGMATPSDVRSAFLALTKVFHPARFGRMDPNVQKLANEVFLGLRAAHETLARPTTRVRQSQQIPVLQASRAASPQNPNRPPSDQVPTARPTAPATSVPPARSGQPLPSQVSRTMSDANQRPSRAPSPPLARPGNERTSSPSPSPLARPGIERTSSPSPPPLARPGTERTSSPSPPPLARPGTERTSSPSPPPLARPGTERTSSPSPSSSARFAAPAQTRLPSPSASGVHPKLPITAEERELAAALEALARSQWDAARAGLQALATRHPGVPRYRALLAYARGREAQLARRIDEARVELEQALQIEPDLQLAKTALGELFTRRK